MPAAHSELEKAVDIVYQLQSWLNEVYEDEPQNFVANLVWTPATLTICVNDVVVYSCQEHNELTPTSCIGAWKDYCSELSRFADG